jgi:ABC-type methionine transport system ATPase subunit
MQLFITPAQDNAVQIGRSLAAWLRVPFLDEATADVPPLKTKKILFH